jgi:hypothetical protein
MPLVCTTCSTVIVFISSLSRLNIDTEGSLVITGLIIEMVIAMVGRFWLRLVGMAIAMVGRFWLRLIAMVIAVVRRFWLRLIAMVIMGLVLTGKTAIRAITLKTTTTSSSGCDIEQDPTRKGTDC